MIFNMTSFFKRFISFAIADALARAMLTNKKSNLTKNLDVTT